MATVRITPTDIAVNVEQVVTQGAGTAIVQANTNLIAFPKNRKLLLWVDSDHASTAMVIAGSTWATEKGLGALTWAIGDTVAEILVIGDSARFVNADGDLSITWATNSAGFVRAYYLPA